MHEKTVLKSYIWITAMASLAMFIWLINSNKTYKAQVDVLIVPKSETTFKNISQIVNNAREIPKTLAFYNEIISSSGSIGDESKELPEYKRKAYWESKIRTETIDDSSIVRLFIFDKDQSRAYDMGQEAGLQTARAMSRYYNIKTEIDARISDGPIVSYGIKENVFFLALKSLAAGIIFGFLAVVVDFILEKMGVGAGRPDRKAGFRRFNFVQTKKEEPKSISFDKKPAGFKEPAEVSSAGKKASAPENLPIAGESVFPIIAKKPEAAGEKKESVRPVIREATPEEVKERLNKLLKGDL